MRFLIASLPGDARRRSAARWLRERSHSEASRLNKSVDFVVAFLDTQDSRLCDLAESLGVEVKIYETDDLFEACRARESAEAASPARCRKRLAFEMEDEVEEADVAEVEEAEVAEVSPPASQASPQPPSLSTSHSFQSPQQPHIPLCPSSDETRLPLAEQDRRKRRKLANDFLVRVCEAIKSSPASRRAAIMKAVAK